MRKRILLVDPRENNRRIFTEMLEKAGYYVNSASGYMTASTILTKAMEEGRAIDLIVSAQDIGSGGTMQSLMDYARKQQTDIPFIIQEGYTQRFGRESAVRKRTYGKTKRITKDRKSNKLVSLINRMLK